MKIPNSLLQLEKYFVNLQSKTQNTSVMDIVNRLKAYIDSTGLSSSQFADRADIPRPTLSQIINGRNKKVSNELMSKLHAAFPDLNIMWLMFGDGNMYTVATQPSSPVGYETETMSTDSFGSIVDDGVDFTGYNAAKNRMNPDNSKDDYAEAVPGGLKTVDYAANTDDYQGNSGVGSEAGNDVHPHAGRNSAPSQANFRREVQPQSTVQATQSHASVFDSTIGHQDDRQTVAGSAHPDPDNAMVSAIGRCAGKRISHIMVFYTDNSYEVFKPTEL